MKRSTRILTLGGSALLGATAVTLAQDSGLKSVIGNVFLQNTSPGTAQVGHANITGTFRAGQVFVQQGSQVTIPVVGNNTATGNGTAIGGSFSSAQIGGTGVRGTGTATTGQPIGVLGITRATDGAGVYGTNTGTGGPTTSGAGVYGFSNNFRIPAVRGYNHDGEGIHGESSGGAGVSGLSIGYFGLQGVNQSLGNAAVFGKNNSTTGAAPGGSFKSESNAALAVFGEALATSGTTYGVEGRSRSTTNGTGVLGVANNVGTNFGVYGICASPNGFGVFSEGATGATGTKSFVIDHPLDPENRYLMHYSAEGPEPRNVYEGSVTTSANGLAWVDLPEYYASVNGSATYQLTVIDDSADVVTAKVTKKISGNRFQVRTNKGRVEVCWRVSAVRNDRWVRKFGYDSQPAKPNALRGTYLQPDLYGKGEAFRQQRGAVTGDR